MKKKRAISLVEVIISLGLLSLLFGTLLYWYHTLRRHQGELESLKGPLMEERYAYQRLQPIFSHMQPPFSTTDDGGVVFIFDRGPYSDPALAGPVLGKLSYDEKEGALLLSVWPYPQKEDGPATPCQHCLILDHLSQCSFEFYSPPDPFKKPVDPEEVGRTKPKEGWQKSWHSSYNSFPAMIKISLTRETKGFEKHAFDYYFDFSVPVIYPKEAL